MIRLERIRINLPGFLVENFNLEVKQGEFFALIGPTGAGKTLVLESIVGLLRPDQGNIWVAGREVSGLPPEKRKVGIVYQDHALFPHLTVRKNITYGLRYHHNGTGPDGSFDPEKLSQRLGISHLLDRRVPNLSGGEKQRTALARALAVNPKVLLLDEPLSALDPNFRLEIRKMLGDMHRELGITCLMVTHDFSDVLTLADRVAVINRGKVEQVDTVEGVFKRPASHFVAEFVGIKNLFNAEFADSRAQIGELNLRLSGMPSKEARFACIRSENVHLLPMDQPAPEGVNAMVGSVKSMADYGSHWEARLEVGGMTLHSVISKENAQKLTLGAGQCLVAIDPADIYCIK